MDASQALVAFAALSQETRLRLLRLLVTAGPDGMSAGALAVGVEASASNVSFHLSHLERAGLIASRREARSIIYSAAYPTLSGLIAFLMHDCCQGRPEVCGVSAAISCDPAKDKANV